VSDEIPGVDDYLTLLEEATEVPWRHDELFKQPDIDNTEEQK